MNLIKNEARNKHRDFFSDDRGLTDMQSTMVAIALTLFLATMISLVVFKTIPWGKGVVAEWNVNAVAEAQEMYATQVSAGIITTQDATFTYAKSTDDLVAAGVIKSVPAGVSMTIVGGATTTDFTDDGYTVTSTTTRADGSAITVKGGK